MWWMVLGCTGEPPADPAPPQLEAQRVERVVIDETRETPALGGTAGSPNRTIRAVVWSGAHDAPDTRPLILVAHGVDGHPDKFEGLAAALIDAGFVVVAPAFPSTHRDAGVGYAAVADLPNQPGDLDALLGVLTAASVDPEDGLYRRFDPERIGAMGHSLGSATLLGWARHPCCRSARLGAAVQVSTPQSLAVAFGAGSIDAVGPATVLLHGEDDTTVPIVESETLAAQIDERAFVRMAGVRHSELIEGTGDVLGRHVTEAVAIGLFREALLGEVGALDAALDEVAGGPIVVER